MVSRVVNTRRSKIVGNISSVEEVKTPCVCYEFEIFLAISCVVFVQVDKREIVS